MKIVLHNYWRSSASHRVRIALGLKKLPFEYVAVNIATKAQHTDEYKALNPQEQVPTFEVIEDDGTSTKLTQSLPIVEYIDERWPTAPSLLPKEIVLRARARALAEVVNSGIQPLQNLSTTNAIKKIGGDPAEWPKAWIAAGLTAYARLAAQTAGQFSVGDAPTIADCCLIPQLASARRFGVDYTQHANLVQIEKRCLELPAFADAAPEKQPDAVRT
jgi:maleylacetoacetate isomerase